MRHANKLSLLLITFFLHSCYSQTGENSVNITGQWKNSFGSILNVQQDRQGNLEGTFTTAVATTQKCIGHPAPVKGFINGNAIAITIDMRGCDSPAVLTQVALYNEETHQIKASCLILKRGEEAWNSINLCNDTYTKIDH